MSFNSLPTELTTAATDAAVGLLCLLAVWQFLIFVLYETTAMALALGMYGALATTRRLRGAGLVAMGIALTMVAGAVQTSDLSVRLIVPFDHNGLFHLVQLIATAVLVFGLRRGLEPPPPICAAT